MDEELAKLVLEVLNKVEWANTGHDQNSCPYCSGLSDSHQDDCRLAEAILRLEDIVGVQNGAR